MINWGYIVARLISAIGSWIDSSNLRNRVYQLLEQREILLTTLDDVARMDPNGLAGKHARKTLEMMEREYGVKLGKFDQKIK